MILLLFLSSLVFSCLTFSWLKIWGKMTDPKHVAKSNLEASSVPSQEPFPAPDSLEEPLQKNDSSSLPKTPKQAEPNSYNSSKDACRLRTSEPPLCQDLPPKTLSSDDASPAPQANGMGPEGMKPPETNGLSSPARSQGQHARPLSKHDKKQEHIKRQLMTNFILGSFDDNSSDEDPGASWFRESSRKGSRASLGALSLEAALTTSEPETPVPTLR